VKRFVISLAILSLISLCQGYTQSEEKDYAWVTLPEGTRIKAEIAFTPEERALGLMFREGLEENEGMLLVFERLDFYAIWMKNMKFSIDIIWLSPEGKVVYIAANVPPCSEDPCPSYQPYQKAIYVLEVAAGTAEKEHIKVGCQLNIELPPDYL